MSKKDTVNLSAQKTLALKEIFDTEIKYCEDLKFWQDDFRKAILNMECISIRTKYDLLTSIFSNVDRLIDISKQFIDKFRQFNLNVLKQENIKITEDMKNSNEFILPTDGSLDMSKYTLTTVIEKYLQSELSAYVDYGRNLPRAVYEFEYLMHCILEFKREVARWEIENDISNLGVQHYLYRPLSKVARYVILNNRVAKCDIKDEFIDKNNDINNKLTEIIGLIDKEIDDMTNYYNLYHLYNNIKYKRPEYQIYALKLQLKSTKIVENTKVLVKKLIVEPAEVKEVYLFNTNILLICDCRESRFDAEIVDHYPIFISKYVLYEGVLEFYYPREKSNGFYPLYLIEKQTVEIIGLYFSDETERNQFRESLIKEMKNLSPSDQRKYNLKRIEDFLIDTKDITAIFKYDTDEINRSKKDIYDKSFYKCDKNKLDIKTDDNCVNEDDLWFINNDKTKTDLQSNKLNRCLPNKSTISKIQGNVVLLEKIYMKKVTNLAMRMAEDLHIDINVTNGSFCGLFTPSKTPKIDGFRFKQLDKPENIGIIVFFSNKNGIYASIDNKIIKIWNEQASKIVYDENNSLLIFQVGRKVLVSEFNNHSTCISPVEISSYSRCFYFGSSINTYFIALITQNNNDISTVYLLSIDYYLGEIKLTLKRKLYINRLIRDIHFINDEILITSNDFTKINLKTLTIYKTINYYDPYTKNYLLSVNHAKPIKIFKIRSNEFLACYSGMGFYISKDGSYKHVGLCFNWEEEAYDFKILNGCVVVLSHNYIMIFSLDTATLISRIFFKGGQFINSIEKTIIFNKKGIFELFEDKYTKTSKSLNTDKISEMPEKYKIKNHISKNETVSDDEVYIG